MPADIYDKAFEFAMKWEGGLSDDADDHGGITKYGVSIELLKDLERTDAGKTFLLGIGAKLPVSRETIRSLTLYQSKEVFRKYFYSAPGFDRFNWRVAWCLFDAAMNCGVKQSVKFAQRGYNANIGYATPLVDDGVIGPNTSTALKIATSDKAVSSMLDAREDFYRSIAKGSQAKFLKGWLNRTNDLRKQLGVA